MSFRMTAMAAIFSALAVSSCSIGTGYSGSGAQSQAVLARELEGRVAGPPKRCISSSQSTAMTVVDDSTLLYRDGRTIWVQQLRSPCYGIANGSNTLVTRQFGISQYCDGDINHAVDLRSGMTGGACIFGPFVPYTKPR